MGESTDKVTVTNRVTGQVGFTTVHAGNKKSHKRAIKDLKQRLLHR